MSVDVPIMQLKSHIGGKNADVTIWPDRIEWTQESGKVRAVGRWTAATATFGASLLKTGVKGYKNSTSSPSRWFRVYPCTAQASTTPRSSSRRLPMQ